MQGSFAWFTEGIQVTLIHIEWEMNYFMFHGTNPLSDQ
jgi:hypothetical protein